MRWNFDHAQLEVALQTHLLNKVNSKAIDRAEATVVGEVIKKFLYSEEARHLQQQVITADNASISAAVAAATANRH